MMRRSKRTFIIFAVLFFLILLAIGFDISRRTTFPGSKKLLPDALSPADSMKHDSLNIETQLRNLEEETEKDRHHTD